MLHKLDKENNKKYTFILKSNWLENKEIKATILQNDVYLKQECILNNLCGELITCFDLNKVDGFCKKIERETYNDYLDFISKRDFRKEQWVYNILDGIAEQEKILYKDEQMVLLPTYTWDGQDISKMYLLAFPTDRALHSIRDLQGCHIDLLEHIKAKSLKTIEDVYGYKLNIIKMYLHYAPTTYHLHIHFVLVSNTDVTSSVEYCHDLNNVIENLKINPNYYQIVTLNKRI